MADNQFNKFGHPGKFSKVTTISAGDMWFTGSNYGASAVIRGLGAIGDVNLSNGGSVSLSDLDAGVIHELGILSITNVASGSVYVLNRS